MTLNRLTLLAIDTEAISEDLSQTFEEISSVPFTQLLELISDYFIRNLPAMGTCLLLFVAGYLVIKLFLRFLKQILNRSKADAALHNFILSSIKIILYVILAITCIGSLGVSFTPLIAALGAVGLAISLAMQGILSNIAGGISVLFSRPFSKGDYVEIDAQPGTITEIGMVYTMLKTSDNKIIYLPNGDVAKATITNFSKEPIRRMDITFSIRATSNLDAVRELILTIIAQNPLALKEPAPVLRFTDQTYLFVKLSVMAWANSDDVLELKSQLIASIRKALNENNL